MAAVVFIIILSVLVLAHELGHFVAAKRSGIRVEEFGLGIPPRIIGKKIGETLYSINLLPFGGFNRITGEDYSDKKAAKNPRSFISKTPLVRAKVLIAGVALNFVLATVLYYIFFFATGFKTFHMPLYFDYSFKFGNTNGVNTVVSGFIPDTPISDLSIKYSEAIVAINGTKVFTVEDVREAVSGLENEEVTLDLVDLRSDLRRTVKTTTTFDEDGTSILGVYLSEAVQIRYTTPVEKVFSGFLHAYNISGYSFHSLSKIISLSVKSRDISPVSQTVAGPVGIYTVVNAILDYKDINVVLSLIDFTALLSLSLAILNLLPFPALDGGRLLFVLIELVTKGKKVNREFEARLHSIGMALLLLLLLVITFKDIFLR